MRKKRNGWSIVEISFCALAMLILMSAAAYYVPSLTQASKEERALSDTAALGGLVSQYRLEVGSYPESLSVLTQAKGQYGPWIQKVPMDVLNKGKNYSYQHDDTRFIVFSAGANGTVESSLAKGISGDDVGFAGR